jgi:hypothetical protein
MEKSKLPTGDDLLAVLAANGIDVDNIEISCLRIMTKSKAVMHWHYPGHGEGWEEISPDT